MLYVVRATAVVAIVTLGALRAQAQEAPPTDPEAQRTAIARALFEEGLELADREEWAVAADRFRRAAAVRDSPPIRFNLAQSLARLGRFVEAVEMLHGVEDHPEATAEVRASAAALRERLESRIARLTVEVRDAPEEAEVMLDDIALPEEALGVALPVDPGGHVVRLVGADEELDREEVQLAPGRRAGIVLEPAGGAAEDEPLSSQGWFWAAVGMVVATGAIAVAIIVSAGGEDPSARLEPLPATARLPVMAF